jgi:hypothetical protein
MNLQIKLAFLGAVLLFRIPEVMVSSPGSETAYSVDGMSNYRRNRFIPNIIPIILVGVRVPAGSRIFTSPRRPDRLWGRTNLLHDGYRGLFPGDKAGRA